MSTEANGRSSVTLHASAVLFDLDGTLHDRARGIRAFAADQCVRLGVDSGDCDRYICRFVELDACGMVWKDRVYEALLHEFALTDQPSIETLVDDYVSRYPAFAVEMAGAGDALQRLEARGVRLGIVTNGRTELQHAVVAALGFEPHIDVVAVSEEVGHAKPEPRIFEIALERLGVEAGNAVMVGDSLRSDIEGAIAAGIRPIAFGLASAPRGVPLCRSMREVVDILSAGRGATDG